MYNRHFVSPNLFKFKHFTTLTQSDSIQLHIVFQYKSEVQISIANVLSAQSKKLLDRKPNFVFLTETQNFGLKCFSLDVFEEMTKLAHPPTSTNLHLAGKSKP